MANDKAVVIGAGLGGLAAAALLARDGFPNGRVPPPKPEPAGSQPLFLRPIHPSGRRHADDHDRRRTDRRKDRP